MHCYRRNTRSQTWLMGFGWFSSNHQLRHFQQLKIVTSCILVLYKMLPILPQNITFSLLTTCSSRKLHSSSSGKYRGMRDFPLFTSFGLYPANVNQKSKCFWIAIITYALFGNACNLPMLIIACQFLF